MNQTPNLRSERLKARSAHQLSTPFPVSRNVNQEATVETVEEQNPDNEKSSLKISASQSTGAIPKRVRNVDNVNQNTSAGNSKNHEKAEGQKNTGAIPKTKQSSQQRKKAKTFYSSATWLDMHKDVNKSIQPPSPGDSLFTLLGRRNVTTPQRNYSQVAASNLQASRFSGTSEVNRQNDHALAQNQPVRQTTKVYENSEYKRNNFPALPNPKSRQEQSSKKSLSVKSKNVTYAQAAANSADQAQVRNPRPTKMESKKRTAKKSTVTTSLTVNTSTATSVMSSFTTHIAAATSCSSNTTSISMEQGVNVTKEKKPRKVEEIAGTSQESSTAYPSSSSKSIPRSLQETTSPFTSSYSNFPDRRFSYFNYNRPGENVGPYNPIFPSHFPEERQIPMRYLQPWHLYHQPQPAWTSQAPDPFLGGCNNKNPVRNWDPVGNTTASPSHHQTKGTTTPSLPTAYKAESVPSTHAGNVANEQPREAPKDSKQPDSNLPDLDTILKTIKGWSPPTLDEEVEPISRDRFLEILKQTMQLPTTRRQLDNFFALRNMLIDTVGTELAPMLMRRSLAEIESGSPTAAGDLVTWPEEGPSFFTPTSYSYASQQMFQKLIKDNPDPTPSLPTPSEMELIPTTLAGAAVSSPEETQMNIRHAGNDYPEGNPIPSIIKDSLATTSSELESIQTANVSNIVDDMNETEELGDIDLNTFDDFSAWSSWSSTPDENEWISATDVDDAATIKDELSVDWETTDTASTVDNLSVDFVEDLPNDNEPENPLARSLQQMSDMSVQQIHQIIIDNIPTRTLPFPLPNIQSIFTSSRSPARYWQADFGLRREPPNFDDLPTDLLNIELSTLCRIESVDSLHSLLNDTPREGTSASDSSTTESSTPDGSTPDGSTPEYPTPRSISAQILPALRDAGTSAMSFMSSVWYWRRACLQAEETRKNLEKEEEDQPNRNDPDKKRKRK